MLKTVADFVTDPVSGIVMIDETPCAVPEWYVSGVSRPVAQLEMAPLTRDYDKVPTPWRSLWRRPLTRLVR